MAISDTILYEFRYSNRSPIERYKPSWQQAMWFAIIFIPSFIVTLFIGIESQGVYFIPLLVYGVLLVVGIGTPIYFYLKGYLDRRTKQTQLEEGRLEFCEDFFWINPSEESAKEIQYADLKGIIVDIFHGTEARLGVGFTFQLTDTIYHFYPHTDSEYLWNKLRNLLILFYEKKLPLTEQDAETKKTYYLLQAIHSERMIAPEYQQLIDEIGKKEEN